MNPLQKIIQSTEQEAIQEEQENKFEELNKLLFEVFKVNQVKDLPFKNLDHAFSILCNEDDFTYNDKEERLSNLLILMACVHASKKDQKVCFISPTWYYAMQAARMRDRYLQSFGTLNEVRFSTVVPGMDGFEGSVSNSSVLFMHGKDYSQYLPKDWKGRKVIQIFEGEEVPVDPVKPCLHYY